MSGWVEPRRQRRLRRTFVRMRMVIARCTVDYKGRLVAHLPEAVRLLVQKADGSLLVHSDTGGYKPLMWIGRSH
jgi:RecB family endonuclease NucS